MNVYQLRSGDMPWGDYGSILLTGMTKRDKATGHLLVERAGPFAPPIALAVQTLVLTESFKNDLDASPLTGLTFRPAHKHRIVAIDWRHWDLGAEDPEQYPAGGEPENYILNRRHRENIAEQMENLWEAHVDHTLAEVPAVGWRDFVRTFDSPFASVVVSERARDWLVNNASSWVSFKGPRQLDDADPTW